MEASNSSCRAGNETLPDVPKSAFLWAIGLDLRKQTKQRLEGIKLTTNIR